MYNKRTDMKMKKCSRCGSVRPAHEYVKNEKNTDGLQSCCRPCMVELNRWTNLKEGREWFHRDGFLSSKDHFNYALRQYARVFDTPSILKHSTSSDKVYRYNRNGDIISEE